MYMLFGVALITANCIASKIWLLPFSFLGQPVALTVGVICYPITFLITDIIGELWGKKEANYAVTLGLIAQIVSTFIITIAKYLPAQDPAMQVHYSSLLGQTWVFVLASLTAYFCSQKWDVYIFHKIRDTWIKKHGSTKGGKWIWNNCSTMSSQLVDSVIYVSIAFGFGFGWFFNSAMYGQLFNMVLAQWLFKVVLAALDTPFFYLLTKKSEGK